MQRCGDIFCNYCIYHYRSLVNNSVVMSITKQTVAKGYIAR